jgi:hypothetical protein
MGGTVCLDHSGLRQPELRGASRMRWRREGRVGRCAQLVPALSKGHSALLQGAVVASGTLAGGFTVARGAERRGGSACARPAQRGACATSKAGCEPESPQLGNEVQRGPAGTCNGDGGMGEAENDRKRESCVGSWMGEG